MTVFEFGRLAFAACALLLAALSCLVALGVLR